MKGWNLWTEGPNFFFSPRPKKLLGLRPEKRTPPLRSQGTPQKNHKNLGRRPKFFFLSQAQNKLLGLRPEKKFRPSAKIVVIFWGVPWLLRGGSIFSWKDLTIFFWDRKKNWAFGTKIPYFRWQNQNFTPLSVYDFFKGRNKANQSLVGNGKSY